MGIPNSTMMGPRSYLLFFLVLLFYQVDGKKDKKLYIVHTKNVDNITSEINNRGVDYNSMYGCKCNGEADKGGEGGKCTDNKFGYWCYVKKNMCHDERNHERKYYSFSACNGHVIPQDVQCKRHFTILKDKWRRIVPGVRHSGINCDKGLKSGWYRFSFPEAPFAKIPLKPPLFKNRDYDRKSCGTYGVAWMDNTLPKLGEKQKDVIIQFTYREELAKDPVSAKVVACIKENQLVYLYYLQSPKHCYHAFCAV